MDYFPRKPLSRYLMDTLDFNKHVHDVDIFINDKSCQEEKIHGR